MSNLETQYTEATNSFEQDQYTPFVYSGLVATKDGTTPTQLDVTSGIAFLLQSDSTLRRRAPLASTAGQFTTATPSTTYYLFLNNDGSWTWGTSSTGPANSLAICQATTDGSGNILAVTDKRVLNTSFMSGMLGYIGIPKAGLSLDPAAVNGEAVNSATITALAGAASQVDVRVNNLSGGNIFLVGKNAFATIDQNANITAPGQLNFGASVGGTQSFLRYISGLVQLGTPASGAATGIVFNAWNGTTAVNVFSVGGQFGSAAAFVDASGNFTGAQGFFSAGINPGPAVSGSLAYISYDGVNHYNAYWTPQAGATALGHRFIGWTGSAAITPFSIGGQFGGALAWVDTSGHFNDNGNAVPYTKSNGGGAAGRVIWVGTTDPAGNAAEGDIWIKA